jgi:polyhydroxyalkanoate synthesis regulator phasin
VDKDQQELKEFLEEQVEWCKYQDYILEKIENKLYEMKELAEYARDNELTQIEVNRLNEQLNIFKQEVHFLEKQLQSDVN